MLVRSRMRVRQFDLPLEWFSRARNALMFNYLSQPPDERAAHMRRVRTGGSVPPELAGEVQSCLATAPPPPAGTDAGCWLLTLTGGRSPIIADTILLATGYRVDITQQAMLAELMRQFAPPHVDGLPVLDAGA
jgi:hypothetical protein